MSEPSELSQLGKAALRYAADGLPVFPCQPRGKVPLVENGFKGATRDLEQVFEWWSRWSLANIGIPTGPISGFVGLDIDPGGDDSLAELMRQYGTLPETRTVKTGRGRQLWFAWPDAPIRNSAGRLGPGLDIRGAGGYVVAPPSIHPNGKHYVFSNEMQPAAMPAWLIKMVVEVKGTAKANNPDNGAAERIPEGQRNGKLTSIAGALRHQGLPEAEIGELLQGINSRRCDPPLPESEVRRIAESISRYDPAKAKENHSVTSLAKLRTFSSIPPEALRWLWPGRIPLGKLTLFAGDPGLGKSLLTLDAAARLSRGTPWPDGTPCEPGDTIILSAEDDAADTIRPRLDAAGADVSRIHLLEAVRVVTADGRSLESGFSLERDISALEDVLKETGARLVSIDPISAYLGGTDSHANAEVRGLLTPLEALAAKHGAAVIAVTHLRKSAGAAIYRAMGSLAFAAAARAVWGITADPDDKARRLFVNVKMNLAPDGGGLAYRIEAPSGIARVVWESGAVVVDVNAAMGGFETPDDHTARRAAEEWLRECLSGGAIAAAEVMRAAALVGIKRATLYRAAESVGVSKRKVGGRGAGWLWELKDSGGSKIPPLHTRNMESLSKGTETEQIGEVKGLKDSNIPIVEPLESVEPLTRLE